MMHHTNRRSVESPGAGRRGSRLQRESNRAGERFPRAASSSVGEQEERARLLVEMAELLEYNPFLDAVEPRQRAT
jgi:hypothetical protein